MLLDSTDRPRSGNRIAVRNGSVHPSEQGSKQDPAGRHSPAHGSLTPSVGGFRIHASPARCSRYSWHSPTTPTPSASAGQARDTWRNASPGHASASGG